ncbi:ATP-binding protein [Pokkaliibacter sp. CJK22405]|uniref:ATP-binding protein n=1 Tax=Pokkaliibacter sp. CJK22405 TaxID=3384615 RepID=UPI00398515D0
MPLRQQSNLANEKPSRLLGVWQAVLVLLLALVLGEAFLLQERSRSESQYQQELQAKLGQVRTLVDAELSATLHLATALVSYIQAQHGELDINELKPWMEGLLKQGRLIRNIGLAPGNRISYIYPMKGNEAALGLYYPEQPQQWPSVKRSIQEHRPTLAGPLNLKQGGIGLIYRVPVFLNDGRYWGLVSTVINADLFSEILKRRADSLKIGVDLVNLEDEEAHSLHINPVENPSIRLETSIISANTHWSLSVFPKAPQDAEFMALSHLIVVVTASMLALLTFGLIRSNRAQQNMTLALQDSQEQFVRVFETAPQGIAVIELDGNWRIANPAFCALLQRSPEELNHLPLTRLSHSEDQHQFLKLLSSIISGEQRNYEMERRYRLPNEEWLYVWESGALLESMGGKAYLLVQVQDLSELKRVESMKRDFVSTVSHELRTPLTSISGSLGLIQGGAVGPIPEAMEPLLRIAHENSLRLGELINDLLDMEKLLAGKMQFRLEAVSIPEALRKAVESTQAYATQHQVTLKVTDVANVEAEVDRSRLQQILANYLSNASKFSPAGSDVQVHARLEGEYVRISVTDQGPGIPAEFQDKVFSKFSQADSSSTRNKGGTGLGLSICRELAERMYGSVGYDTVIGEGTTFWVSLPVALERRTRATLKTSS